MVLACNKQTEMENQENNPHLTYFRDTISIGITAEQLQRYFDACSFIKNEETYLAGYNRFYHTIDFYNLSKGKHIRTVELDAQGPDKVRRMHNFAVHNDTVIFLSKTKNCIYLVDAQSGELISDHMFFNDIVMSQGYYIGKKGLSYVRSNNFTYSKKRKSVLFEIQAIDIKPSNFYENYFIGEYMIEDSSFQIIKTPYPEFLQQEQKYYADLLQPLMLNFPEKVVYNFPAFSKIFVYNRKTLKTKTHNVKSQYIPNKAPYKSFKLFRNSSSWDNGDYILGTPQFKNLWHNKKANHYYRLNQSGFNHDKRGNRPKMYLHILNKRFQVLDEIRIHLSQRQVFPGKKGLYYFPENRQNQKNFEIVHLTYHKQ